MRLNCLFIYLGILQQFDTIILKVTEMLIAFPRTTIYKFVIQNTLILGNKLDRIRFISNWFLNIQCRNLINKRYKEYFLISNYTYYNEYRCII